VILSVVVTFLQVFTGSFAAYGFSKIRFPGRDVLFLAYIGTLALPWQSYMVPQFILMSKVHLTDTLWAIVALQAFGPLGVFLMKQFYESIPYELSEAARIDGMSEYGIYRRIILPLSKPALATLAVLTFVNVWNDFFGPLVYLSDVNKFTVPVGLAFFQTQDSTQYGPLMAGATLAIIPTVLVFVFAQKYFTRGISMTGIK